LAPSGRGRMTDGYRVGWSRRSVTSPSPWLAVTVNIALLLAVCMWRETKMIKVIIRKPMITLITLIILVSATISTAVRVWRV